FWRGVPPKSKGDWAFISHMIETLNEQGKAGVVVPHGVLFRGSSEGKIRKKTIEENLLEAVIGLPANLFFGTGIPAAIMVFNKQKCSKHVLFIDASKHYESAKNQNKLRPIDIDRILATYKLFSDKLKVKNEKLIVGDEERILETGKITCVDSKWINDPNGDFSLFTNHSSFKIDKYAYVATFDEIQENDFNLNIPRYVDTFEEEAEVD